MTTYPEIPEDDIVLVCPACGVQYLVASDAVGEDGRRVRCASCGHGWHQDAVAEEPEAGTSRPTRMRSGILAAILLSMAVGGVAVLSAGDRPTGAAPLELKVERRTDLAQADGSERLSISGHVLNRSDASRPVPDIHAQVHDARGRVVHDWRIPAPTASLAPNESAPFGSADVLVPGGAKAISLSFDDAGR